MREIENKVDDSGDGLSADAFNAYMAELENIVTSADIVLNDEAGPDTDFNMISKAVSAYTNAGSTYQDSGTSNSYVLSLTTNLKPVYKYYDRMTVMFKAGNSCTGASVINVSSLGAKNLTKPDGSNLSYGDLRSGEHIICVYILSEDRFEIANKIMTNIVTQTINGGTPWTSASDGPGTGLDADTCDGYEGAFTANDSRAKTALNATGSSPIYAVRAWVVFTDNGNSTGTQTVLASKNVSSVSKYTTGSYGINFTIDMSNTNYGFVGFGNYVEEPLTLSEVDKYVYSHSIRIWDQAYTTASNAGPFTAVYFE